MNSGSNSLSAPFFIKLVGVFLTGMLLAGCSEFQLGAELAKQSRRTAAGGIYKVGTPYKIAGDWYYPKENTRYDKKGVASWYGPNFQGRRTANGEIFDMNLLTAAHPTLPMPVMAEVTNLENGRSLVVRINDRGPFKKNREIDLSKRAAELLGFQKKGTAYVRVRYLRKAPLYDSRGNLISGSEPDSYFLEKPSTPKDSKYVTAAPKTGVTAVDLTGNAKPRPQTLAQKTYYVQVGVFSRQEAALALASDMQGVGNVEIEPVFSGGMDLFRVRIGPASSRFDAKEIADKVLMRGHQDSYIIEE
ncbi:MAG: septal ring lytic transglycosylase RlpA family protein [Parvibaculales bacterium]